jgi:hypothetical protein
MSGGSTQEGGAKVGGSSGQVSGSGNGGQPSPNAGGDDQGGSAQGGSPTGDAGQGGSAGSAQAGAAGGDGLGDACTRQPSGDAQCFDDRPPNWVRCVGGAPENEDCVLVTVGDLTDYYCCP